MAANREIEALTAANYQLRAESVNEEGLARSEMTARARQTVASSSTSMQECPSVVS